MSTETTLRYIETLRCLPVGKWRTTGDVYFALRALGHQVTKRTVERDLHKLAKPFGIENKEWGGNLGNEWRRTISLERDADDFIQAPGKPVMLNFASINAAAGGRTIYATRRRRNAEATA